MIKVLDFTSMGVYNFLLLVRIFTFKEQTKKKQKKGTWEETHHHRTLLQIHVNMATTKHRMLNENNCCT
jgi:hypothetical protein